MREKLKFAASTAIWRSSLKYILNDLKNFIQNCFVDILETKIRLFGVANDSIVDGPGLRYSIYTQGCPHHCAGCHNPESWAMEAGEVTTIGALVDDIQKNQLIHNVTISGGDPFVQAKSVSLLVKELKTNGYTVWIYSGWTLEELTEMAKESDSIDDILNSVDVLVDGKFIESQKSLELKWKGSSNQRVIDMVKSRKQNKIVLWQDFVFNDEIPPNW